MKNKLLCALVVVMMVVAVFGASPVKAAAYGASFTTSITYQNVGADTATVSLEFYAEGSGTPIIIARPDLEPMAGTSIFVGSLGELAPGFKGSAVMVSNQPLVATLVQVPAPASGVKVRPLSNGFTGGSDYILVPTALRNTFNANTIISVQNVDSVAADFQLVFVPVSGSNIVVETLDVPAYATRYYDLAQMPVFTGPFNGSVQVFAFKAGTTEPGAAVASAMELRTNATGASAVEATNDFRSSALNRVTSGLSILAEAMLIVLLACVVAASPRAESVKPAVAKSPPPAVKGTDTDGSRAYPQSTSGAACREAQFTVSRLQADVARLTEWHDAIDSLFKGTLSSDVSLENLFITDLRGVADPDPELRTFGPATPVSYTHLTLPTIYSV